jgi:hypothetical protein
MLCGLSDNGKLATKHHIRAYSDSLSVNVEKSLDPRVCCGTRLSIGAVEAMEKICGTQPKGLYKGSARIVGKL